MANRNDSRKGRRLKGEIEDQLATVNRVTEAVKGGRRMRFTAPVVAGDEKGHVGSGTGRAQEVSEAAHKAVEVGRRNMIPAPTVGATIPHKAIGHLGSGNILLKPAEAGSGVVAGGAIRIVTDMVGIAGIISKSPGSNTPISVVRATIDGLKKLRTRENVLKLREPAKSLQD